MSVGFLSAKKQCQWRFLGGFFSPLCFVHAPVSPPALLRLVFELVSVLWNTWYLYYPDVGVPETSKEGSETACVCATWLQLPPKQTTLKAELTLYPYVLHHYSQYHSRYPCIPAGVSHSVIDHFTCLSNNPVQMETAVLETCQVKVISARS